MNKSNIEAGQPGQQNTNEQTAQNEQVSQPNANTNVRHSYFLVLDKKNKVICDFTDEKDAKSYVTARPYLKYEPFTYAEEDVSNMDWF